MILALAVLAGPHRDAVPAISIRIHLGRDHASKLAASELRNDSQFFLDRRRAIYDMGYKIEVDDDALDWPTYQIGRGDTRHRFPPGAFNGSGVWTHTLKSIVDIDRWEREYDDGWRTTYTKNGPAFRKDWGLIEEYFKRRPEEFPTQPPKPVEKQPDDGVPPLADPAPIPGAIVPPPDDSIPDVVPMPDPAPPALP